LNQFILPKSMRREGAIERIARVLGTLSQECAWVVEVKEHKPTRSTQQNRYLWGVVYPTILKAGKLEGWTAEEVHDYCLGEHFGWETVTGFGKRKVRPIRRSGRLNKQEFSDYIAFIQRRMAEHGIVVPDPDPEWFLKDEAA
jgi:hypothetical protein